MEGLSADNLATVNGNWPPKPSDLYGEDESDVPIPTILSRLLCILAEVQHETDKSSAISYMLLRAAFGNDHSDRSDIRCQAWPGACAIR